MPNRVAAIERAPEWASLFRDAPVAIAVTEGPDDRYVYVNAEFLRIAGRAADHFLGRTVADAAVGEDAKGFAAAARRIRETKAGLTRLAIPTRIDRADGLAEVFLDVQIEPLRTADARVGGVLLVVVDATARVHAERRAASLEVAQNAVLEQMPNAVLLVDRKGSFVMGNLAARRLAGDADLGRLTLAGLQATFDIRTPDRIPIGPDRSPLVRALRGEEVPAAEYVVRRPSDGSDLWINYAAAPLRDAQGTITGAFGVIADMTTEHRLRETIAASEERLRRVYEAVGCGLLVRDKDGTIVFANQEAASIFGVSAELLIGTAGATGVQRYTEDGRLMPPDAVPSATAMREVRALRDVRSRLVRSDGTVSWVRIDAVPVPSRDGSIDYVVTSFVDITERYRAEQRLALRARQQAAVAELGRIALAADDLQSLFDETVRTVNGLLGAEACRIIEHDPAERRLTVRAGQRLGGESSGTWIPDGPTDSQAGYTIAQGTDVIANDLATETRFKVYRPILDAGFRSTVTTIISGHDRPFGMVAAISRDTVFAPDDVMFLRAVANVLGEAIERLSAIERLRTNEARLRTVVENLPLELMVYDAAGRVTLTSGRRLAGRQSEPPAVGDSIYEVNKRNPDGLNRIVRALRGEEVHEEVRSGDQVLDMRHHPVIGPGGNVTEVVGLALDVTERSRAQAELSRKEAFVRAIFDSVQTHLAVLDRSGVIVDANQHWLSYVRSGEADLKDATIGDDYLAFLRSNGGDEGREAAAGIEAVLEGKRPSFAMEFPLERANVRRWFQLSVEPLRAADGGVVLGHQDVTERKRVEEALEHQALHDNVTDLPNRTLLRDRLRQAILAARRRNTQVALLFIDLDRFKELNDTFGHQAGDVVLREVGERFVDAVRASDTVARLGGDEFAVLIPLATDRDEAVMVARRVLASLQEPFVMEGESAFIEASIGVVLCPEHGEDVQTLMRRADVAMYQAKRAGSGLQLYEAEKDLHSPGAIGLAGDLRHSIERGELLLHFQPIVDLAAGRCVGVEALCRWEHPTRGLIPPGTFIPLAEENGFIRHIGLWTMQEAMQLISGPNGALVPVMSVNLSMRNLRATDLAATFAEMLERTGADPTRLKVEITETAMMADAEHTLAVLGDIQRMGIRLSIDDFGTGYSSLAYLQRLPVDDIKVDRSFVLNMLKNSGDAAIVRSTIELAHSLGLRAIAEGVEDQPTLNRLRELRCDRAQGFYIGRPMPMAQLVGWLTTSPWRTVP